MSIKIYVKYVKNNRDFHTTKLNLPTGNLDKRNAIAIAELLGEAAHKYEKCVIVVTHSEEIAKYGDVILEMTDGKLEIRRD